jgi:hypothetical protein
MTAKDKPAVSLLNVPSTPSLPNVSPISSFPNISPTSFPSAYIGNPLFNKIKTKMINGVVAAYHLSLCCHSWLWLVARKAAKFILYRF